MRVFFLICGFSNTTDRLEDEIRLNLTAEAIAKIIPLNINDPEFANSYPLSVDDARALLRMSGVDFVPKPGCDYFLDGYMSAPVSHE